VNDGEVSKPSYATYIKDRLHGFGGSENRYVFDDLVDFPDIARRVGEDPSRQHRHAPGCVGEISVKDLEGPKEDVTNLKNAVNGEMQRTFMSAASPGVASIFFKNEYYKSHEDYVFALAEGMRAEY